MSNVIKPRNFIPTILNDFIKAKPWTCSVCSCFLSLLIIAAVLYKIKHKYDSYRRRQVRSNTNMTATDADR